MGGRAARIFGLLALSLAFSGCGPAATGREGSDLITKLDAASYDGWTRQGVVVVDFFAPWCASCRGMDPIVTKLASELAGKVRFGKVDCDAERSLASRYEIGSIPFFVILKDGELLASHEGPMDEAAFRSWVGAQL